MRSRKDPPAQAPWWRRLYDRLVHLDDTPGRVAGGFAIGIFIGVAPTFGLGILLSGFLSALFRCNIAAAVVGSAIGGGPLIFAVWAVSAWIGALIFGIEFSSLYAAFREGSVWQAGGQVFAAYLVGNVFVTAISTTLAYFGVLAVMRRRASRAAAAAVRRPGARPRAPDPRPRAVPAPRSRRP